MGDRGKGTLLIEDGGQVASTVAGSTIPVGWNSGSEGYVTVDKGSLRAEQTYLGVGYQGGTGALMISNGGTLIAVFLDGYQPELGDTFLFFNVGETIDGEFSIVALPVLESPEYVWDTSELYTNGSLTVTLVPGHGFMCWCSDWSA